MGQTQPSALEGNSYLQLKHKHILPPSSNYEPTIRQVNHRTWRHNNMNATTENGKWMVFIMYDEACTHNHRLNMNYAQPMVMCDVIWHLFYRTNYRVWFRFVTFLDSYKCHKKTHRRKRMIQHRVGLKLPLSADSKRNLASPPSSLAG